MTIIAMLSRKGGTGKSTAARNLAVAALLSGLRTAIIDADEQGTLVQWATRRPHPAPAVMALGAKSIDAAAAELTSRGAQLIFLDLPPHAMPLINSATKAATVCLVITEPTPESLEQVGTIIGITKAIDRPAALIINKAPSRSHALNLARAALATFGVPVCPQPITQLIGHAYASAEGLTAQEREPSSKAAKEIEAAWEWLQRTFPDQLTIKKRAKRMTHG